nr:immunoglobulin light chain junction region [Macaca mulatta]
CLQYNTSPLTF